MCNYYDKSVFSGATCEHLGFPSGDCKCYVTESENPSVDNKFTPVYRDLYIH